MQIHIFHGKQQIGAAVMLKSENLLEGIAVLQDTLLCQQLVNTIYPF